MSLVTSFSKPLSTEGEDTGADQHQQTRTYIRQLQKQPLCWQMQQVQKYFCGKCTASIQRACTLHKLEIKRPYSLIG